MNHEELVRYITAEVMKKLASREHPAESPGSEGTSVAPREPVPTPDAGVSPPVPPAGECPAGRPLDNVGTADLTGRQVISRRDLEHFAGTSLRVDTKAVITPLAVDYLREKGIRLERVENTVKADATGSAVVPVVAVAVAPDTSGSGPMIESRLKECGLRLLTVRGVSYEDAVKKVCDAVASGAARFGVCLESTGMLGPITANRNPNIRAVHCRNTMEARAARVDFGCNVLVLDTVTEPLAALDGFCGR